MDSSGDKSKHDSQKHAHIQHLDAQDQSLATSAKGIGCDEHIVQAHELVHGIDEDQECKKRREASLCLLLARHACCKADTEDDAQIVQDRHQGSRENRSESLRYGIVEERNHLDERRIGENIAYGNQDAGNRQNEHWNEHGFRECLHCRHCLVFHE